MMLMSARAMFESREVSQQVLRGEGSISPVTPRNQHNEQSSRQLKQKTTARSSAELTMPNRSWCAFASWPSGVFRCGPQAQNRRENTFRSKRSWIEHVTCSVYEPLRMWGRKHNLKVPRLQLATVGTDAKTCVRTGLTSHFPNARNALLHVKVLHRESDRGQASLRTTTTMAQTKPPTQPCSHQTANKQNYKL